MPKGYLIAELTVTNPAGFDEYRQKAPDTIAAHGGRFVTRGGAATLLEGTTAPGRMIVLEFDSPEQAHAWYNSPAYQAILPLRLNNSTGRAMIVAGFDG